MKSAPKLSGSPVAWFASLSMSRMVTRSCVSCCLFGTLIRNVIVPASSFEVTMVVMSGAAGSSPTES